MFGGVFDNEFRAPSEEFFEEIRNGRFSLVTSAVVQAEIDPAPQQVKDLFEEMLAIAELIDITEEAISLRDAYLETKIVSANYSDDALHVALATVSECSLIVSWNFRHIVHFEKIPLYNGCSFMFFMLMPNKQRDTSFLCLERSHYYYDYCIVI
ncbi:MAG: type II toxin-antitoxin system VapC family toxin, partial [Gammaproteobacteria bacterium]